MNLTLGTPWIRIVSPIAAFSGRGAERASVWIGALNMPVIAVDSVVVVTIRSAIRMIFIAEAIASFLNAGAWVAISIVVAGCSALALGDTCLVATAGVVGVTTL